MRPALRAATALALLVACGSDDPTQPDYDPSSILRTSCLR